MLEAHPTDNPFRSALRELHDAIALTARMSPHCRPRTTRLRRHIGIQLAGDGGWLRRACAIGPIGLPCLRQVARVGR